MRAVFLLLLLLGLAPLATPAQAQTAANLLAQHKPPVATATPAAPAAPAIIPGSPLAALAGATSGAAPAPAPADTTPAPFGTDQLGFVISGAVGGEAVHAFHSFLDAVRASTRLTPVTDWLTAVRANPARRAETTAILLALLIAVLPATLVDAAIRFGLRRPVALCARWALPRQEEFLPSPEAEAPAETQAPNAPTHRFVSLRAWLRRLAFALVKFLLAMLPLAGFIITAQVFMSGFVTTRAALLAATGTANAYLVCRAVQELARLLVSPAAPSLRLITMPSPRAQALMKFLLIVLATGFFAFSLISGAMILGLPRPGAEVLTRIAALAVHLEAAYGIWQCRRLAAGWIIGDPAAKGAIPGQRQRFGRWWHFFALF